MIQSTIVRSTSGKEFKHTTRTKKITAHPAWVLLAAFGTYFCMYGFRKPYTASTYAEASFFGIDYKILLIIAQTLGYVTSKWLGIKLVSQIKPQQRIGGILALIGFAELMLLLFGIIPRPWNICCLFLNGLPLGIVFGLVLGFVEGRSNTEFLIAGLCASFIVSDGVSKSVGSLLLNAGISENWMPAVAGGVFLVPTLIFTAMLAVIPPPTEADIARRSARNPMDANDRWQFFVKYAPGIIAVTLVYLFVTLLRSIRADFAVELWNGLGYRKTPQLFTQSELIVSFGIILIIGLAVLIRNNYRAFHFSLSISLFGFLILLLTVLGLNMGLDKFYFMVLAGLGVYIPYVAVHAIVFERLLAITRERANVGFLMYIVDSVGYTGYIILMIFRYLVPASNSVLSIFVYLCVCLGLAGILAIVFSFMYFFKKLKAPKPRLTGRPAAPGAGA